MSCYYISFEHGAKVMRPVSSAKEYRQLRNTQRQHRLVKAIRNGDMAQKQRLLQMNYSCLPSTSPGESGPLKGAHIASRSVGMDIDFVAPKHLSRKEAQRWLEEQMAGVPELVMSKREELGLLLLERSASKGYHVVFRRKFLDGLAEGHLLQNQVKNLNWASELLGVAFDQGAKDLTRVFFTTTSSATDLIYLDEELFDASAAVEELPAAASMTAASMTAASTTAASTTAAEASEASVEAALMTAVEAAEAVAVTTPGGAATGEAATGEAATAGAATGEAATASESLCYNGIPYRDIIAKYWEMFHAGREPQEGDRNVKTFELALALRPICDYSQQRLEQIIPNYWLQGRSSSSATGVSSSTATDAHSSLTPAERAEAISEWRKTIENALREPRKGMPYRLRQVLQSLHTQRIFAATGGTATTPPPLPKKLPALVELLTRHVPDHYKAAVASAIFPALATHLHGVKFRYWDNKLRECTFMHVLVGSQSVGKGCIKSPIEMIMEPIAERDKQNRAREAEWKRLNPSGKSKAKDPRPQDICIQYLINNLTDAAFNQRVIDAHANGERYLYTSVDELEALRQVTSKGTADELCLMIRNAFDNERHGQERVGSDSISGIAPLRWNWNASTTPANLCRFFANEISKGTITRLDVAMITDPGENFDPIFGIYDDDFRRELKPYLTRLDSAHGLIECPEALLLSREMKAENEEMSRLCDSKAYFTLSKRANVIAWLKGMLLYVASNYEWDETIAEFVHWSQAYSLYCKMVYFGASMEREIKEENNIMSTSGPRNLLTLLPAEFTLDQFAQMRYRQGKTGDGQALLRQWQSRHYIEWDSISHTFHKIGKFAPRYDYQAAA